MIRLAVILGVLLLSFKAGVSKNLEDSCYLYILNPDSSRFIVYDINRSEYFTRMANTVLGFTIDDTITCCSGFCVSRSMIGDMEKLVMQTFDSLDAARGSYDLAMIHEYHRQYLGYINSKGDSLVFIIFFNKPFTRVSEPIYTKYKYLSGPSTGNLFLAYEWFVMVCNKSNREASVFIRPWLD